MFEFENTFAEQLDGLYVAWQPEAFASPELIALNQELAAELKLDPAALEREVAMAFAGGAVPAGAVPLAQAYAGHQFGGFAPQLGDGRAVLLGELLDRDGHRRDLQLKGSGRTPFSRGGDGRAALGPVLREYIVGEAMHRLGIPTTRTLAAITTGETVQRQESLQGAMLARVAASHIRVGTFEYFGSRGEVDKLSRLTRYALERHFPGDPGGDEASALLGRVAVAQGELIAQWMLVGFIHGVMNTDNTTISGETIDYGPCAFMDVFDPSTVFSSIDRQGRYAYGNQPSIGAWNISRLGVALASVLEGDRKAKAQVIESAVAQFVTAYQDRWLRGMREKLGLEGEHEVDEELAVSLLGTMHREKLDFTATFRELAASLRGGDGASSTAREKLASWTVGWRERLAQGTPDLASVAAAMDRVNPIYVPRNHLVEEALAAAAGGDLSPFRELVDVLTDPYTAAQDRERYALGAPDSFGPYVTFCGT